MKIAILGGTGKEGQGLARSWARAGHEVIVGSRAAEKAVAAAAALNAELGEALGRSAFSGADNAAAAAAGEIVALTVPYAAQADTLEAARAGLAGKVLIVATVPLDPENVRRVRLLAAGSASAEAQAQLGAEVRVISAFQNIAHEHLASGGGDCDVFVTGNDKEAKALVMGLVRDTGLTPWDAGSIENAVVAEALTSVLININIRNKVKSSGIRITGVPQNRPPA